MQWIEEVRSICGPAIPVILVGCKSDLRPPPGSPLSHNYVQTAQGQEVAREIGARAYKECSALRGEGVDEGADLDQDGKSGLPGETNSSKEAALLTAALELALIVLDGCLDLDGGRSLSLEHTALLVGAGEWANKVFGSLEEGAKVLGGGGAQEARLRRGAAAVLLKADELTSRWRRSMVDLV